MSTELWKKQLFYEGLGRSFFPDPVVITFLSCHLDEGVFCCSAEAFLSII